MSDAMTAHAGDDGAMHDGQRRYCPAPGCGGADSVSGVRTAGPGPFPAPRWYSGTWCPHGVKVFEAAGMHSAVAVNPWPCTEACRAVLPAITSTPVPVVWHISTVTGRPDVTVEGQSVTGGTWTEWDDPSPVD